MASDRRLPFDDGPAPESASAPRPADFDARRDAVDPTRNVALEASAGTGKTRVLVDRYVNLLRSGVDPANVLAITFTRKAAAEMRQRIVATLRDAAGRGDLPTARWSDLRDRLGDITISTIDAFCLSLLREFPLEADVDPGFAMADETEVPRLVNEALDRALRACRGIARQDEAVALVFAQLGEGRLRRGIAALLDRRLVAPDALRRYLARGPRDATAAAACAGFARRWLAAMEGVPGGLERFLADQPLDTRRVALLALELRDLHRRVEAGAPLEPARVQALIARLQDLLLTRGGEPRRRPLFGQRDFATAEMFQRHRAAVLALAPAFVEARRAFRRDLNVVLAHGVWRAFAVTLAEYRDTLEAHAVLDFSDALGRALALLRQMDEFAQSRYRLESRYHHVLVDEFQDTSRAQWELVSLLVQSWGEGFGLVHDQPVPPSVFIVGDRKQSIYGFRDADVAVLDEASRYIGTLRGDGDPRRQIVQSFRAVPPLLAFVNDVCAAIGKQPARRDAFRYDDRDRFPVGESAAPERADALGIIGGDTPSACAAAVATEVALLLAGGTVRDRQTGVARPARPGDVAVLFRSRDSHREFECALDALGIPTYVYKGLGFFDADEVKDVLSLLWYLAESTSDLRAAAWLRSRFVHLSDEALRRLAPGIAAAIRNATEPPVVANLADADRTSLRVARTGAARWLALVDRVPAAELIDRIIDESAYAYEIRGARATQARENLKKIRGLVRRIQNRGYTTFARIVERLDQLSAGDESNAMIDAVEAVNLMTVHAAKGLEFPVVFAVNLARGAGGGRDPVRVVADAGRAGDEPEPSVTVGDYRSDADEDTHAREREETKRLVYVAITRARDRLYLSSVLRDGRFRAGRGSLGEVLPGSLTRLFEDASRAGAGEWLEWESGQTVHRLRVGRAVAAPPAATPVPGGDPGAEPRASGAGDDFEPVPAGLSSRRLSVLEAIGAFSTTVDRRGRADEFAPLAGTLVHRLFQHAPPDLDREAAAGLADELLTSDDVPAEHRAALVERAVDTWDRMRRDADVQAWLASGRALHEVPFSVRIPAGDIAALAGVPASAAAGPPSAGALVLRGTIDCIVEQVDGGAVVLELKTGVPHPVHEAQLAVYVEATRRLYPGARVEGRLIYPR